LLSLSLLSHSRGDAVLEVAKQSKSFEHDHATTLDYPCAITPYHLYQAVQLDEKFDFLRNSGLSSSEQQPGLGEAFEATTTSGPVPLTQVSEIDMKDDTRINDNEQD
jgi:hypothetical protein